MQSNGSTENTPAVEMGVCISNRNTHGRMFADVYVNRGVSAGPGLPSCSLALEIWDKAGGRLAASYGHPCQGHIEYSAFPWSTFFPDEPCGPPVHASAWIYYGGTFYRIGDSPQFVYCGR